MALDWVFTVEGGARVRVCRDGRGVMRGGRNESGWVRIGESLTLHVKIVYIHKGLNGQCTDSTAVRLHYATGCHKGVLWWQPALELM